MSVATVGLIAAEAAPDVEAELADRCDVVRVEATPGAVHTAAVDAWCVLTKGLSSQVLYAVRDANVPGLFLVHRGEGASWLRVMRKGVHDVAWLPHEPGEVRARVLGMLARRTSWNHVTSALCREIAHDLRGPLQALHFTIAALQSDDAVAEGYEEDVDALLEAADVAELMLSGVSNLGRRPPPRADDAAEVDLTKVLRTVAARRSFGGKVTVDGGESMTVRINADALESAVEDMVRVVWIRSAGQRHVRAQCFRFGEEAVLTVQARAYDALLAHLPALLWRERPILLRRERVPMPLAGLAYSRDVASSVDGHLTVRRDGQDIQVEMRLPLA